MRNLSIRLILISIVALSCGTNNEQISSEHESTCSCRYPSALHEEGYKSQVKSVKYLEYDVNGDNLDFKYGRIENYDEFGRIPFYHMLTNENDLGDKETYIYDENGCVYSSYMNSAAIGDTVTTRKYDYSTPGVVKVSFCGNFKTKKITSTIDKFYNENFQLTKSVENSIYFNGGWREKIYSYDENGNLISEKSYDYGEVGVKEYPSDSTISEFSDGRIVRETTYGNGKVVLTQIYEYVSADDRGNWTEMKHTMTWSDLVGVYLIRRTIEYY